MADLTETQANLPGQQVSNGGTGENEINSSSGVSTLNHGSVTLVDWKVLDPQNYLL